MTQPSFATHEVFNQSPPFEDVDLFALDAPLVEAPAFMSPPRDRRDLPMHYVPPRKSLLDRAGSLVHTTFSLAGLRPARGRGKAA